MAHYDLQTVKINVGGTKFIVRIEHLKRYPQTRLGKLANMLQLLFGAPNLSNGSFATLIFSDSRKAELDRDDSSEASAKQRSHAKQSGSDCYLNHMCDQKFSDEVLRLERDLRAICDEFDLKNKFFFFDRDPVSFSRVLELYRTDELHLPAGLCSRDFQSDLSYWGFGPVS